MMIGTVCQHTHTVDNRNMGRCTCSQSKACSIRHQKTPARKPCAMEHKDLLLWAIGHFVGSPDVRDDGIRAPKLAAAIWMLLEKPQAERTGDSLNPGRPGLGLLRKAHRQLTFHMLIATCRSFRYKLHRLLCCSCQSLRPPRYFHRADRDYLLGEWYWVQDKIAYPIRRGNPDLSPWVRKDEGTLHY